MTLRVGCAGAGYFSQFHIGSWQRMSRAEIVGVCDFDRDKAAVTSAPAFRTVDEMLAKTRPDILDIILPPAGHAGAIRAGLAAGVGAIICQKPFCRDLKEAAEMVGLAASAGVPLIIHENFRFQPWFRAIKQELDSGSLGDVLQVTFRLRPGDGQGPRAYLDRQPSFQKMRRFLIHETGVHYIDVFRYLLGDASHVYADLRQINPAIAGEDAGYVIFDHPLGTKALLDGNRLADHSADNTRRTMGEGLIEGSKGTLTLAGDGAVTLRPFGTQTHRQLLGPDPHDGFGGDCTHALQLHVVSGLLDDTPLENLASDYLGVIQTEEAIYRSSETQRKVEVKAHGQRFLQTQK
ncbi:Gfo/Idh/MocA family oxidoreductase [Yoonia sp. SS1-5]|uniref:Gfo/Idh/MocA family protein n=1 Tax=Yoonia rhodophyticola TaxID=3137370 RepID=A0AAN0NIQ1_9RHOB